jgi:hypothetical protein
MKNGVAAGRASIRGIAAAGDERAEHEATLTSLIAIGA